MGRHYSSSDGSDYEYESSSRSTAKSSKSKKKSSRRSRSSSYDSSRKRTSRRSRSSSYDSYSRKRRSSRSSSYERDRPSKSRRRTRSRSNDSLDYSRRSKKSKSSRKSSRSRSRSPYRSSKSSKSRRSEKSTKKKKHVDAVIGLSTGTLKDVMDIVPGFSKMTPAEQARIRVQKQLKIAAETPDPENYTEEPENAGEKELTVKEQIERARQIITIQDSDEDEDQDEDAGFMPSHFRSSKKKKLKEQAAAASSGGVSGQTLAEREGNHELAIFGNTTMLTIDQAIEKKKKADDEALANAKHRVDFMSRDPKELASKELLISQEDADRNWLNHLKILKLKLQREGFAIG